MCGGLVTAACNLQHECMTLQPWHELHRCSGFIERNKGMRSLVQSIMHHLTESSHFLYFFIGQLKGHAGANAAYG
jgi:hypothetical protein